MMLGGEYRQLHPRVVLDFHQHTAIAHHKNCIAIDIDIRRYHLVATLARAIPNIFNHQETGYIIQTGNP